ncbi:hypothetical protein [Arthrobacter sp. UYEF3]|uniref:hypothetical protein n=1 Tax=Arthrobacter sp. UYEF3 TaxID=1756365 RepID=UPI003391BB05
MIAEGSGILVLELEDFARARRAEAYGRIAGAAANSDAGDIVAAGLGMQRRVMQKALVAASLTGPDIGFAHAHTTSTPLGDRLEASAIAAVAGIRYLSRRRSRLPATCRRNHRSQLGADRVVPARVRAAVAR